MLHGHVRVTGDLDLVVGLAPDEAQKAIDALVELGLRPSVPVDAADFAGREVRRGWIEDKVMQVFSMQDPADPLRRVELFVEDAGFEGLWNRSALVPLAGMQVRVASIDDLVALKRTAGRTQDLADVVALQQLRGLRPDAMSEPIREEGDWAVSFEAHQRSQLIQIARETTPAQRLAWLEEMIELARHVGPPRPEALVSDGP